MKRCKVAIADDHPLVLDGLKTIVEGCEDLELIIRAENGQELLDKMRENPAEVVLLDIDMPVKDGIETTRELRQRYPQVRIIILTMHDEKRFIQKLISEGAHGYLLKNCNADELLLAIRNVNSGKNHFSGEVTMKLMQPDHANKENLKDLTEREVEVLALIAKGKSNREVGEALFISHRTVDTHRTNLMKKLDVHNIAGLIRIAYNNRLVD